MDWVALLKLAPVVGLGGAAVAGVVLAWAYRGKVNDAAALVVALRASRDELRARLDAATLDAEEMLAEHKAALAESEALRREQLARRDAQLAHLTARIAGLEADLDAADSIDALRARLRRKLSGE